METTVAQKKGPWFMLQPVQTLKNTQGYVSVKKSTKLRVFGSKFGQCKWAFGG
jgi:hypothetical protein